jgi:hypothetical protein
MFNVADKFCEQIYVTGNDRNVICFISFQNPYIKEEQTKQWPTEKVQRTKNDLNNLRIKLKIEQHET